MLPDSGLYSIAAHRPFLEDLTAALLTGSDAASDPLALSRMTVLLPTRRACRAIQDTFLRLSDGRALVLPRMIPIGDVDEDELAIADMSHGLESDSDSIPPAMPDLRRRLLLTKYAARPDGDDGPRIARGPGGRAGRRARAFTRPGTDRAAGTLVPSTDWCPMTYAAHWQQTLAFLQVLTEAWPQRLEADGGG